MRRTAIVCPLSFLATATATACAPFPTDGDAAASISASCVFLHLDPDHVQHAVVEQPILGEHPVILYDPTEHNDGFTIACSVPEDRDVSTVQFVMDGVVFSTQEVDGTPASELLRPSTRTKIVYMNGVEDADTTAEQSQTPTAVNAFHEPGETQLDIVLFSPTKTATDQPDHETCYALSVTVVGHIRPPAQFVGRS